MNANKIHLRLSAFICGSSALRISVVPVVPSWFNSPHFLGALGVLGGSIPYFHQKLS
jgi:hypothetical protein